MASDRQIKANQENGRLSSRPMTLDELLAHDVLREEDRADYLELLAALEAEFPPDGPTQSLVRRLALAQWRLERLHRIETGLLIVGMEELICQESSAAGIRRKAAECNSPEERYDEVTRLLGRLFLQSSNGDPFSKLARYETVLSREYFRALKALIALNDPRRPTPPARRAPRPQPIDECRAPVSRPRSRPRAA